MSDWILEIFQKWQNRQDLPFSGRRIRRYFGVNIIWKQSGMIRSVAKSIRFCRKNIKERSCAIHGGWQKGVTYGSL